MSIDPKTNDYVPGGKWLAAPGSARESGLYALAMAMASNATDVRPLRWSPGVSPLRWSSDALEKRYYDALKAIQEQYTNYSNENEDEALLDHDLQVIIDSWHRRYRDMYRLYVDDNDHIYPVDPLRTVGKIILLRRAEDRWEACCHFETQATGFTICGFQTCSSEPRLQLEYPSNNALGQAENHTMHKTAETLDGTVHKSTTSIPDHSANDALVNTLEALSSGIKELTLAIEQRLESEKNLCTAMDKLITSLDKTIQAQTHTSFDDVTNDGTYKTGSESSSTPSTP
ncbi:hypothetical protein KCU93_g3468, partial [Aureobasidium melanogenum]